MVLPASIRAPIRNDICGMEAQPLAPARAIGASVPGKLAVATAWSAIVAEGASPSIKGGIYG